jgi:hypothetical protein
VGGGGEGETAAVGSKCTFTCRWLHKWLHEEQDGAVEVQMAGPTGVSGRVFGGTRQWKAGGLPNARNACSKWVRACGCQEVQCMAVYCTNMHYWAKAGIRVVRSSSWEVPVAKTSHGRK